MAITIQNTNLGYYFAYNDINFVVSSDNIAQPNFKFVCDVVIGSESIRLTASKDTVYSEGVFNLGKVLESYVSSDISKSTYGFQQNINSYKLIVVKFGEQYGTVPVVYPNLSNTALYVSNGMLDYLPNTTKTALDYLLVGASVKTLMTNKPTTVDITDSEHAWLYMGSLSTSGVIYEARVRTYDSAGALIQTVKVYNPYQACLSANDQYLRFGCGTSNLNSIPSSGVTTGSLPIITASVASYDVTFEKFNGTLVSTPQVFTVTNPCTQNNTYRFHFLNKLGGFDSFTFIRGSKKTMTIKRNSYKKNNNRLLSTTSYSYQSSDRESTQVNVMIKDNVKVLSDWISETTMAWLEELVTSPEVYLDDLTYGLVAVNILNNTYELKQGVQDKLFNLELEFEYSYDRYRQRR